MNQYDSNTIKNVLLYNINDVLSTIEFSLQLKVNNLREEILNKLEELLAGYNYRYTIHDLKFLDSDYSIELKDTIIHVKYFVDSNDLDLLIDLTKDKDIIYQDLYNFVMFVELITAIDYYFPVNNIMLSTDNNLINYSDATFNDFKQPQSVLEIELSPDNKIYIKSNLIRNKFYFNLTYKNKNESINETYNNIFTLIKDINNL